MPNNTVVIADPNGGGPSNLWIFPGIIDFGMLFGCVGAPVWRFFSKHLSPHLSDWSPDLKLWSGIGSGVVGLTVIAFFVWLGLRSKFHYAVYQLVWVLIWIGIGVAIGFGRNESLQTAPLLGALIGLVVRGLLMWAAMWEWNKFYGTDGLLTRGRRPAPFQLD